MNSAFRARWLASPEVISQVPVLRYVLNKVTLKQVKFSLVYTKRIIYLSVGESGKYSPCRFAARQISTTIHLHFGE